MAIIIADKWVEQICRAEGIQWNRLTRIIIDCQIGEPVRMYITQLGTDAVVDLLPPDVQKPEIVQPSAEDEGSPREEKDSSAAP